MSGPCVVPMLPNLSLVTTLWLLTQGLLNRWTSQLDLGSRTGGLERVVSIKKSVANLMARNWNLSTELHTVTTIGAAKSVAWKRA